MTRIECLVWTKGEHEYTIWYNPYAHITGNPVVRICPRIDSDDLHRGRYTLAYQRHLLDTLERLKSVPEFSNEVPLVPLYIYPSENKR